MMQIPCPWCGARPENEFHCGGTTGIARAALDSDDIAWGEYLFFRANPHGLHAERWLHGFGCGQWFNLLRDTVTHEIRAIYAITERAPEPRT
jgi:sarcosine oxidase, subunit delta